MSSVATLKSAFAVTTCRDRMRQLLSVIDAAGEVDGDGLASLVASTNCPVGHNLHFAALTEGLLRQTAHGSLKLSREGKDWLLESGRPAPTWDGDSQAGVPPLRAWQRSALDAWVAHGRHGVVEAVTGTGKSRVGVEAVREALEHDFNTVVAVPTADLVEQWVKTGSSQTRV